MVRASVVCCFRTAGRELGNIAEKKKIKIKFRGLRSSRKREREGEIGFRSTVDDNNSSARVKFERARNTWLDETSF